MKGITYIKKRAIGSLSFFMHRLMQRKNVGFNDALAAREQGDFISLLDQDNKMMICK